MQVNVTSRVLTARVCCFSSRTWSSGSSCINNLLAKLASFANSISWRSPSLRSPEFLPLLARCG
ncbi:MULTISPECIES: hypothetical protein [Cyanophyceae]|uniref:hypothetical protein n=1 Tax=Cyanophyceae TaxID=3028117 RepID=UPI0018C8C7ED|nr:MULTISPECIES: hypothetical protein [Cyanophyceae]